MELNIGIISTTHARKVLIAMTRYSHPRLWKWDIPHEGETDVRAGDALTLASYPLHTCRRCTELLCHFLFRGEGGPDIDQIQ
jgi:hypothetical protein